MITQSNSIFFGGHENLADAMCAFYSFLGMERLFINIFTESSSVDQKRS